MKIRVSFLFIFLGVLLLTPPAISGTLTDHTANDTFDFTYTTVSTSVHIPGIIGQAEHWEATDSASISGAAIELGNNTVYDCELWLMVTGDIDSSEFPSKDNIDQLNVT